MIWHILRYWITFIIPAFYKRIQAKNIDYFNVPGPVIISMNHPNAFTDPILITYLVYPLRLKFLARGDAFKPGLVTTLLESIGIIPIFRLQDAGREGLKKNDESYRRVNHFLKQNGKVIVFSEGLCVQERRLRPLKKGVARMVFGAYEALKDERLIVIPVCVNYSKPDKFRSTAFYNIGEPLLVKDFIEDYKINPARAQKHFLGILQPRMKQLLTHINDPANDELVYRVEEMCKTNLIIEKGMDPRNLEHDFIVLNALTEKVNRAAIHSPKILDEFRKMSDDYFPLLKKHGLHDSLLDPKRNKGINFPLVLLRWIFLTLGLPIYIIGMAGNYLPYRFTKWVTTKIVRYKEFYSSFFLGDAMILFLLWYVLLFSFIYSITDSSLWAVTGCIISAISALFNLYYHPFVKKTAGITRLLLKPRLADVLRFQKAKLISLINKF